MDRPFSDRNKQHEDRWALDEELRFKAAARRNKMLGAWAATEMGLTGEAAEAYAKTVVRADFQEPGDDDVFRKVSQDLKAEGLNVPDTVIRKKMHELMDQVRDQLQNEG